MHAPRLPNELTDYAIDFLHDDPDALRALALTSYTTLPSARYHLFHAAQLHSADDLAKFTVLVEHNPHLRPYIQSLTLSKAARPTLGTRVSTVDTSSPWETTLAASSLPVHLTALKTLHLNNFLSFWQPTSFSVLSFAAFARIQSLHISDSSLRSFTELRLLLAALPDVRALVLDGVGIGMKPEDLTWLNFDLVPKDDDDEQRQQLIDGTQTPLELRQRAQSLFRDPVALTSLRISHRSSSAEAFTPSLSVNALTVLFNYLLATPTVFSLNAKHVVLDGFDALGEDTNNAIKAFRDALVKASRERDDWA
ncbi:hypothetical protein BXZ70DRAFT_494890 [Cristinia sonorae]|uniref:Uncharacterized protein n=1 Tax=Cristinia sonorae TaxID=1940300 RepID=A0A8K0UHE8_9AGAR|nr:hypothetical protein BXZ70DRAFT_494890 [Cristinia sonorae]